MAESFRILSPADGAIVGRTVTLVARRRPRLRYPRYFISTMSVRFGAAGPVVAATKVGGLDWQATGVLPAGTLGGAQVDITVTVEGSVTINVGTEEDPVEEIGDLTETDSVGVVTESTFPDVRFDPYPRDVTVSALPYRLELTGSAVDVGDQIVSVEVSVDALSRQSRHATCRATGRSGPSSSTWRPGITPCAPVPRTSSATSARGTTLSA